LRDGWFGESFPVEAFGQWIRGVRERIVPCSGRRAASAHCPRRDRDPTLVDDRFHSDTAAHAAYSLKVLPDTAVSDLIDALGVLGE